MLVGQSVLDRNYKHLNNNANMNLDGKKKILTIIAIAIIIAQRENSHKIG